MRSKLLILIILLTSSQAFSQIGIGDTLIGGSIQYQRIEQADFQEISILPNIQYFFRDNISIGGGFGVISHRNNLGQDNYARTRTYNLRPEVRYYIGLGENIYFYGVTRLAIGFGGSTLINGNVRTNIDDRSTLNFALNPGILYTLSSKIILNFEFNLITFNRNVGKLAGINPIIVTKGINLGINTFTPVFGLYYRI